MKHLTLTLFLFACLGSLALNCYALDIAEKKEAPRELPGWGVPYDLDDDCKIRLEDGALLMTIPGDHAHDLAAETETINAPRVLQTVQGDFTIQVKVEGGFAPGAESLLEGRTGYNGAALVALMDDKNVVTLARAVLQRPGRDPVPYANFEIRVGGQLQRFGLTGDQRLPKDGPVYLRLARRDGKFLASVSTDGTAWKDLEPKEVPADWPKDLQAGVAAISSSQDEFKPRFSKLQLEK